MIVREGADRATFAEIADEAGVSIGLLQHYFRTRASLLIAAFEAFNDAFIAERGDQSDRRMSSVEALGLLLTSLGSTRPGWSIDEYWSMWLEYWAVARRNPDVGSSDSELRAAYVEPFTVAIERGISDGTFKPRGPVDQIVECALALLDGLAIRALLEKQRISPNDVMRVTANLLDHELGCSPAIAEDVSWRLSHSVKASTGGGQRHRG